MNETVRFSISGVEKNVMLLPMGGKNPAGDELLVDNISFIKNGKRILPVMGELQYSRWEDGTWEEEVRKMISGGVDIISTYCIWDQHQEAPGEWDFTGCRDSRRFLQICKDNNVYVWYRIGPWVHGEARHGGFPDYVQYDTEMVARSDDPKYLALVKELYGRYGKMAEGMFYKDGGPIIGVQLENEYGHCGGPADREEQRKHMKTLLRMAREAGMDAPFYSATAWGRAMVIPETLPVFAGYVDEPWDTSCEALPARENFLFIPYRDDAGVGSDFGVNEETTVFFDLNKVPYLTCEMGGGLQVTSRRRPIPTGTDTVGNIMCAIGSGANMAGYYLYHGGINPDGKYTNLNECQAIGGHTNVPVKSYDFYACINEAGLLNDSYGMLKKYHYAFRHFGDQLAGARLHEAQIQPSSAEDMKTIRGALRYNDETGAGFLFLNNHQRNRSMEVHENVTFVIDKNGENIRIENVNLKKGGIYLIPFDLKTSAGTIRRTNANLLCILEDRIFLWSDDPEKAYAEGNAAITILSQEEADRAFLFDDGLYITENLSDCIIAVGDKKQLLGMQACCEVKVYRADGSVEKIAVNGSAAAGTVFFAQVKEEKDEEGKIWYREYEAAMTYPDTDSFHRAFLHVDYAGDRTEVYINDKLVDDWFTSGAPWNVLLDRFGRPEKLTIRIYDTEHTQKDKFGQEVYYDVETEKGCKLNQAEMIFEYASMI